MNPPAADLDHVAGVLHVFAAPVALVGEGRGDSTAVAIAIHGRALSLATAILRAIFARAAAEPS